MATAFTRRGDLATFFNTRDMPRLFFPDRFLIPSKIKRDNVISRNARSIILIILETLMHLASLEVIFERNR